MITLTVKDGRKRVRTLNISGFLNDAGTKCARVVSDNGDTYFVRIKQCGYATCTCTGNQYRVCYHIKAVQSVDLLTVSQIERVAAFDVVAAAVEVVRQHEEMTNTCPHCHKYDINFIRYGRCYWLPLGEAL